jgi:hypothetical protein
MNFNGIQWADVQQSLDNKGYAVIRKLLPVETCKQVIDNYDAAGLYRSVINMQRYRFGKGEYKYFNYPLPSVIQTMRENFYKPLSAIANSWMEKLSIAQRYPMSHAEMIAQCEDHHQKRPTPLILRYEPGGYNTLHQDLYGEIYFPFQVVIALNQRGVSYEGGEFILLEQIPRAQSKGEVILLDEGDAMIFTTNFRPVQGTRGYYRATMKHGVSEIKSGVRYAMGIIFHDAT